MAADRELSGGLPREGVTAEAEGLGSAPLNSGETYFRFMVDMARDAGQITEEGRQHILAALYGDPRPEPDEENPDSEPWHSCNCRERCRC